MKDDDLRLLIGTRRGEEPAARLLWSRHGPRLIEYAALLLRDRAAGEDAVQEVFCAIMRTPVGELRRVRDVAAYLTAATRGRAISMLRSTLRRRKRDRSLGSGEPALAEPRDQELRSHATDELRRLPRRYSEVLVLVHGGRMTFAQIEAATGIPRSTAADRYQRGMERLGRRLGAGRYDGHA